MTLSLFLAGVATFALLYTPQPLLPLIAREWALQPRTAALAVSVATTGVGVAMLVAGPLSEVVGRTPLMKGSLWAAALVGLGTAVVGSWPLFLFLRSVEGVVLAGLPAVAVAYLSEEVADHAQAKATGMYIGGTALGGMTGRLVAGFGAQLGGWRWGEGLVALLGLLCAALVAWLLPRSQGFTPAPASLRGLAAANGRLLRDPAMLGLFAIGGLTMGAFVGTFNAIGFRLEAPPYTLPIGIAGLVFLVYTVGSYTSPLGGRLAGRFGRRPVQPVTAMVMLTGLLMTLLTPLWMVLIGLLLYSAGFFAAHGVASGWVAARARRTNANTGQATAGYLFCYYAGSSVFGALAARAWQTAAWQGVVALDALLVGLVIVIALLLVRVPAVALESIDGPTDRSQAAS